MGIKKKINSSAILDTLRTPPGTGLDPRSQTQLKNIPVPDLVLNMNLKAMITRSLLSDIINPVSRLKIPNPLMAV